MVLNLSAAVAAFRSGRFTEAEGVCRQVLAFDSSNAGALNLLGVLAGTAGQHDVAADLMRESVALAPDVMEYRKNLVRALMREGLLDAAGDAICEAMQLEPESPHLLALWGAINGQQGDAKQGIESLEKAIRQCPEVALFHFNLAELHRRNRDREAAMASLERALEVDPHHAAALNNLSGLQLSRGDFLEALGSIQRLLKITPRSSQAYCNLGILLGAAGDSFAAAAALRNAIQLEPESPRARFQLANMLIGVGKLDEADALMRELRTTETDDPVSFRASHARILERKGDIQGAAEILDAIDEEDQLNPDVAIIKAIVQQQQGQAEKAIKTLEVVLQTDDVAAVDGIGIHFALGQLYDACGRYDEAFAKYHLGNENRKEAFIKFDRAREPGADATERLLGLHDPEAFRRTPSSNLDTEIPIFIVGMPRSGTSLTEQILATHSQVYGAGELLAMRQFVRETYETEPKPSSPLEIISADPSVDRQCMVPKDWESITAEQLRDTGKKYLEYVRGLDGEALRITDKMPYNYYLAPVIHKVFPRARIIHCRRHPLDTCLSCFFQNFTGGSQYAFDLTELGTFYRNYLTIMEHWRDALKLPMLEVDYQQLVNDPEPNVRRILDYCGLEWEPQCLKFHKSKRLVNTASYQQVRQPIYTKSAGRWRHYENHLQPVIESLGMDLAELEQVSSR